MKRKLIGVLFVVVVGLGYCKPPLGECVGVNQKPSQCRGTYPPKAPMIYWLLQR